MVNRNIYSETTNPPTNAYGNCPQCKSPHNKIIWGWHGVYYDLVCENNHVWKYNFPIPKISSKK